LRALLLEERSATKTILDRSNNAEI
jgi:hypothetical protein